MEIEVQNTTESSSEINSGAEVVTPTPSPEVKSQPVKTLEELKAKGNALPDDNRPEPKVKKEVEAVKPEVEEKVQAAEVTVSDPEKKEEPKYSPDFKYKAWGQEKELDPRVRDIIKDKETEDWIKTVFAKADGIDQVAQHRDYWRTQHQTLATEAQKVFTAIDHGDLKTAMSALGVNTQDIGKVMQGLGYAKDDIIKYAYALANLTPEQEQAYAQRREEEIRNNQHQEYTKSLEEKLYDADVKLKSSELRLMLSTPGYSSFAKVYDQHNGEGAFWDEVCRRGEYYDLRGQSKSTQELIEEVGRIAKLFQTPSQNPSAIPAGSLQATPAANIQQPRQAVPVIPNVSGGGASPAKRKPTSIADLKAAAADMED